VRTKEGEKEVWLAILGDPAAEARDRPPAPDPMLASANGEPFDDPGWAFEPKWDGLRAIAVCQDETRLISRNRNDVTAAYPELHKVHERLVALDAMVDGEIVCFEAGHPSFERLQTRMHVRDLRQVERLMKSLPVTFIAFDLLYLDGRSLVRAPFEERRRLLEETLVASDAVQLSPSIRGSGMALFEAARAQHLEGIVAKRVSSPYEVGRRSRSWRKIKTVFDADVVIGGWSDGKGRRSGGLGALLMGAYADGELRFVGEVGTGFDDRTLSRLLSELEPRVTERSPFSLASLEGAPREVRQAHWVRPELVATVEFRELTTAGKLRAGSFKGLRTDKAPGECTFSDLQRAAGTSIE
jgi:bifunctional non-homologous end joining protein LigD